MSKTRPGRAWTRALLPFELVALVIVVATVAFLRGAGLRVGWEAVRYSMPPLASHLAKTLFLWAPLLHLGALLVRRRSVRPYLRSALLSPRWLFVTLRALVALAATMFAYMWLKVSVPLINGVIWDPWFWQADAALHLGVSPNVFLVTLFADSPFLVRALDAWYAAWAMTCLLALAWFVGRSDNHGRVRTATSMVLLFGLGSWLYLAMPTLGPCYVAQEVFTPVRADLPRQVGTQDWLWQNYQKVNAGRHGPLREFNPNLGVAAMPSLHVAAHSLIVLWAWRLCRPLLVPSLLGTFLTLLGSVLTGWHYAVDGYVGVLLAVAVWWASGHLCRHLAPDPAEGEDASSAPDEAPPEARSEPAATPAAPIPDD